MDQKQYQELHYQIVLALPRRPKKNLKRSLKARLRQEKTIVSHEGNPKSQRVERRFKIKALGIAKRKITKS
jgi:hypothetical protein